MLGETYVWWFGEKGINGHVINYFFYVVTNYRKPNCKELVTLL